MKKIAGMIVLCVLVCMTQFVYAKDSATVVLDENFESFRLNTAPEENWTYDSYDTDLGIYAHVISDPDGSNNKVFKYIRETGGLVYANRSFEPIGGKVYIDYRFRLDDKPSTVQYIGLVEGIYNLMAFQGTYELNGGVANMGPNPNVWHTFHIEIDFLEKCYTAMIDGLIVRTDIPFANQDLESIDTIRFPYSDGWVMIDDLKISYEGGIVKNYTKLETEKYVYANDLKGIYNVPLETEVDEFLKNITFVEDAVYGIYESDGETPWTKRFVDENAVLKVQSPDLLQESILKIHQRPWMNTVSNVKTAYKCVVLFDGTSDIMIKNKKEYIDSQNTNIKTFIEDGKIYVPLRRVCEAFSKNVDYDADSSTVTVDGMKVTYETKMVFDRTFIDAQSIAELIGVRLLVNEQGLAVFCNKDVDVDPKDYTVFVKALNDRK